jgi:protein-disulfide isomerase
MNKLNRRHILTGTAALSGLALTGLPAVALDVAELNKPPELGDMSMGPADAKVTFIEYASATCPHCAVFYRDTFPALKSAYIDTNKLRFIFREFPLNDAALAAFMIARAAPKEAYFPLIDTFFRTLETWAQGDVSTNLFNIAKQAGFTKEKFDATLKDEALAKKILAIRADGEKFGVDGTPTFFINGEKLGGEQTIDALKAKIDPLLG